MAYANEFEAKQYYAGDDANQTELSVTMQRAALYVQRYAPEPVPYTEDYAPLAAAAELEVGRYLWDTSAGAITSASATGGGSVTFANSSYIKRVIRETMATYYTAAEVLSVTVNSTFPDLTTDPTYP